MFRSIKDICSVRHSCSQKFAQTRCEPDYKSIKSDCQPFTSRWVLYRIPQQPAAAWSRRDPLIVHTSSIKFLRLIIMFIVNRFTKSPSQHRCSCPRNTCKDEDELQNTPTMLSPIVAGGGLRRYMMHDASRGQTPVELQPPSSPCGSTLLFSYTCFTVLLHVFLLVLHHVATRVPTRASPHCFTCSDTCLLKSPLRNG